MDVQTTLGIIARSAERVVMERGIRSHFFDDALFNDPCWNILSACFAADAKGQVFKMADALDEARVTQATGRRWLDVLRREGWLTIEGKIRAGDAVNLTNKARKMMAAYFCESACNIDLVFGVIDVEK